MNEIHPEGHKKDSDLESWKSSLSPLEEIRNDSSSEVENREIYRQAWTKNLLVIAYAILIFTAFVETFAGDSTSGFDSYATSSFDAHALIATAAVVYKITAIISYPLMAKLSDFFGRAEGFGFAVFIYTLAYVLYAACQNVSTYICAELFYAVGKVGYRIFQQIFIADTTSLINRGLWSQLPDAIAAIPALWVGSIIQDAVIDNWTWRWGYGIWAIILAVSCFPLIAVMHYLDKRSKQTGEKKIIKILQELPDGPWYKKVFHFLYVQLDIVGMVLMTCGLALFFVPMSMTGNSSPYRWHEAKLIVMLVLGFVIFCVFILWNAKFARNPFVPKQALLHPTVILTCVMVALMLCTNSSFATYFKTVLQVSGYTSVGEASRIDNTKKVCVEIFLILCGLCMKYVKRTKLFVFIGVPLMIMGHGLLVHFTNNNNGVSNKPLLYMAEVFIGAGRGITLCALQVTVQAIAGSLGIPMSTAFFLAFNSVGSLIGSCIAGGIWNSIVLRKLDRYLPADEKKNALKIYKSIKKALAYKKGTETRDAIAKAYRETVQIIGWVGLGVLAPMLILMFFIQDVKLTEHNDIYADESDDVPNESKAEEVEDGRKRWWKLW